MSYITTALTVPALYGSGMGGDIIRDVFVFDGSSYLDNGDLLTEVNSTGHSFAISFSVYVEDVSSLQVIACIGRDGTGNHYIRTVGIDPNGGDPRFFHGSYVNTATHHRRLGTTVPVVGQWYDVLIAGTSNQVYLYVDGKTEVNVASDGNFTSTRTHTTNGILRFGRNSDNNGGGSTDYFTGKLCNILVSSVNDFELNNYTDMMFGSEVADYVSGVFSNVFASYAAKSRLFDENQSSTVQDETGDYDLTNNGVTFEELNSPDDYGIVAGTVSLDNSYDFVPTDFIQLPSSEWNANTRIGSGNFSTVLWFKPDSFSQYGYIWRIGDADSANADLIAIVSMITTGVFRLTFRDSTASSADNDVYDSVALNTGEWHMLALTRSSSTTFKLWLKSASIDTTLDHNSTNTGTHSASSAGDHIGVGQGFDIMCFGRARPDFTLYTFDGKQAGYALWRDRVLTDDEVEVLYGAVAGSAAGVPHDIRTDRTYNSKTFTATTPELYIPMQNRYTNVSGDTVFPETVAKDFTVNCKYISTNYPPNLSTDGPAD